VAAGNRANDKDGTPADYRLGDLEIAPAGRNSGSIERPADGAVNVPANANGAPGRGGAPRNLTLADSDLGGPALELDLAPQPAGRRSSPRQAVPPGAAKPDGAKTIAHNSNASVLDSFGENSLGDDFEDGNFAKLPALDLEQVERRSGDRVVVREATPQSAKTKQANEASELELSRTLAGFGDAPGGLIASVRYALHVTRRLIALRGERAAQELQVQQRAQEHNAASAAMGQALMAIANQPSMEPLRSKVARVHDERAKVEKAGVHMERTREDNQRVAAALEQEATALRQKLEPFLVREKEAAEAQRRADEEVRRAQAMQKRVEIELRALNEAGAQPDSPRLVALEMQLTQRRGVVGALLETLGSANEVLGQARRELALSRGSLDAVEEKQKRLMAAVRAREAEVEGQKRAADGAFEAALRELADAARLQKLEALVQPAADGVRQSEAALNEAGNQLMRFDRALKLYAGSAVFKGYALMVAIVALGIAAWVLR
jgi:hypothetical protein